MDETRTVVREVGRFFHDLGGGLQAWLADNPAPAFTLLGALLAMLTARLLHFDKVGRERRSAIRAILGQFVAAVTATEDAKAVLVERRKQARRVRGGPMAFVREMRMDPPTATEAAMDARVADALEEVRRADGHVDSLFFQLSIVTTKAESDVVFASKLLRAAHDDGTYATAYNFLLAVAKSLFGDSRSQRRAASKAVRSQRPTALRNWERHVAAEEVKSEAESGTHPRPAGAGHPGNENDESFETQGGAFVDHGLAGPPEEGSGP